MELDQFIDRLWEYTESRTDYCIYKLCFGELGEYISKVEKTHVLDRYDKNLRRLSTTVKEVILKCPVKDFKFEILETFTKEDTLKKSQLRSKGNIICDREEFYITKSRAGNNINLNIHRGGAFIENDIIREFINIETKEIFQKSCSQMMKLTGIPAKRFSALACRKKTRYRSYCLLENYVFITTGLYALSTHFKRSRCNSGPNNPQYGKQKTQKQLETVRRTHTGKIVSQETREKMKQSMLDLNSAKKFEFCRIEDGEVFFLTVNEMAEKFSLNSVSLYSITNGRNLTNKGFCLAKNLDYIRSEQYRIDKKARRKKTLSNRIPLKKYIRYGDGLIVESTPTKMEQTYGGSRSNYHNLGKDRKTHNGWRVYEETKT